MTTTEGRIPEGNRFPPLTARSVLLSVLLGSHPPELPVRSLVRVADLFGISEGSARVALSRLNSDGDVISTEGIYRLSPRLAARQAEQDRGVKPATRPWRGDWELAVADPAQGGAERTAIAAQMARLRLGELRPGVWARPDNLDRDWPPTSALPVWRFRGRADPAVPVSQLWDLEEWAATAESLIRDIRASRDPAERFVIAAAMVRHLRSDPVLPASLLPRRWPGSRLRAAYDSYRRELGGVLERVAAPTPA